MTNLEIQAFLAICKLKNISKAAEELFISQSSLSARLKTLEDELGYTLILRNKGAREIALTPQGQTFYTLALQHQEIERKMKNIGKTDITDELKVSVLDSLGNYMFTHIFEVFTRKYPNIKLTIQDMEAEMASINIICGRTDVAFSNADIQTEQIISTPFLAEPYAIVTALSSDLPDVVAFDDLPMDGEVYTSWSVAYKYWHRDTFGTDYIPRIELDLMGQFGLFASEPGRWAIIPESIADNITVTYPLRKCKPGFTVPDRVINVLQDRDKTKAPNVVIFLDTVRQVLSETVPGVRLL
ncbi:MAG: LysR family transcriptional regulator [Clostridia bacterium]|nr:LysR family transcriptional regulator [Clostridia bacterium]